MGRRTRKRAAAPTPRVQDAAPAELASARPRRRARATEAPEPIWAPFPLVELIILLGIVLVVVGLVLGGRQGGALLGCGILFVCLASLELAVREHLGGYRSHSSLLALVPTAVTMGLLFLVIELPGSPQTRYVLNLVVAGVVFAVSFLVLREVFRRRSGGLTFRA